MFLKERHIARHMDVEKNLQAIEEATWLISYLKDFPRRDHSKAARASFWPVTENSMAVPCPLLRRSRLPNTRIDDVLQSLPPVMVTSFFRP